MGEGEGERPGAEPLPPEVGLPSQVLFLPASSPSRAFWAGGGGGELGSWGRRFPGTLDSTSPESLGTWVTALPCSQASSSPQDWLPRGREDLW